MDCGDKKIDGTYFLFPYQINLDYRVNENELIK